MVLAKYGCCCDEIKFYTLKTIKNIWESTDVFITADTEVIKLKPKNKKLVIVDRSYNKKIKCDTRIKDLKEIESFENL